MHRADESSSISSKAVARARAHESAAFTLVEAVMALVILAIVLAPLTLAMQRLSEDQVTPVMASRARWLAVEKIEEIIADRHSATRGYEFVANERYPDESWVSSDTDYARSVAIVETGEDLQTPGTGYKVVTVTVAWDDPVRGRQALALEIVLTSAS